MSDKKEKTSQIVIKNGEQDQTVTVNTEFDWDNDMSRRFLISIQKKLKIEALESEKVINNQVMENGFWIWLGFTSDVLDGNILVVPRISYKNDFFSGYNDTSVLVVENKENYNFSQKFEALLDNFAENNKEGEEEESDGSDSDEEEGEDEGEESEEEEDEAVKKLIEANKGKEKGKGKAQVEAKTMPTPKQAQKEEPKKKVEASSGSSSRQIVQANAKELGKIVSTSARGSVSLMIGQRTGTKQVDVVKVMDYLNEVVDYPAAARADIITYETAFNSMADISAQLLLLEGVIACAYKMGSFEKFKEYAKSTEGANNGDNRAKDNIKKLWQFYINLCFIMTGSVDKDVNMTSVIIALKPYLKAYCTMMLNRHNEVIEKPDHTEYTKRITDWHYLMKSKMILMVFETEAAIEMCVAAIVVPYRVFNAVPGLNLSLKWTKTQIDAVLAISDKPFRIFELGNLSRALKSTAIFDKVMTAAFEIYGKMAKDLIKAGFNKGLVLRESGKTKAAQLYEIKAPDSGEKVEKTMAYYSSVIARFCDICNRNCYPAFKSLVVGESRFVIADVTEIDFLKSSFKDEELKKLFPGFKPKKTAAPPAKAEPSKTKEEPKKEKK